jgi:hypothetical protein
MIDLNVVDVVPEATLDHGLVQRGNTARFLETGTL